jgi:Apea-like HEPN
VIRRESTRKRATFSFMTLQIHPEAARRFDELGNQLLAKLAPEQQLVRAHTQQGFRPDIHPVFNIPEEDIVGGVQVKKLFFNGAGEEVGRLFEHEGHWIGVVGEDFKALVHLAERLHQSEPLRDVTSITFIHETAFDWMEGKYKNGRSESLTEFVVKRTEEEIKDFEIWVPLHRTYIESSIQMGRVTLRTITRAMMDEAQSRMPVSSPKEAEAFRLVFARDRSAVQGCAAASIKIRAEKTKAVEVAREQAEAAAAFLRFLSPANWTPKLRSYCAPLGSENVRRRTELFLQGDSILTYSRGVLDSGDAWALSNSDLASFPGLANQLSELAAEPSKTPFRQNLYDALLIYSRNSVAIEPADKLIFILVAVESMLLRNSNEPIGQNIGERMAFLIGNSLETRKAVVANVDEVYRLRSSFLHHGNSISNLEVLSTFMLNAWSCFVDLLGNADHFQTKDELISALEDRKLS